nr:hypothetical protein K-LCC10_0055 [Kaumoebavirus]
MNFREFPPEILEIIAGSLKLGEFVALELGLSKKFYWRAHAKYLGLKKAGPYFYTCKNFYRNDFMPNLEGIYLADLKEICSIYTLCHRMLLRKTMSGLRYTIAKHLLERDLTNVQMWWKDSIKLEVEGMIIEVAIDNQIIVNDELYARRKKTTGLLALEYKAYSHYVHTVLATIIDAVFN